MFKKFTDFLLKITNIVSLVKVIIEKIKELKTAK